MDLVAENNLTLKGFIKRIFTDERRGKGNAFRAAILLIEDGHLTKEDFERLADIMEHWYGKTEDVTWGDLLSNPEGTIAKEAVDSIMQKFVIESEKKGSLLKAPAVNVVGALLQMDIKASGIGGSWGTKRTTPGKTTLKLADRIVRADAESANKLKAAEAVKPAPIKKNPTDKMDDFNGTAGMVAQFMDQTGQAFARAGLQ